MDNWVRILQAVQAIFFIFSIFAAIIAVCSYRRQVRINQANWLLHLFQRYYEEDNYKMMRQILDYGDQAKIHELQTGILDDTHRDLVEKLVDYLNFFEFIACLMSMGQLTQKEVKKMFEYYLRLLGKYDFIIDYIHKQGFENLYSLLIELRMLTERKFSNE